MDRDSRLALYKDLDTGSLADLVIRLEDQLALAQENQRGGMPTELHPLWEELSKLKAAFNWLEQEFRRNIQDLWEAILEEDK